MKLLALILIVLAAVDRSGRAAEMQSVVHQGKRMTICTVDLRKEQLRMFHRDEAGAPLKRLDRLATWLAGRGASLVFATNAGMYHADYSAVGLLVIDGREQAPLNLSKGEGNFFLKPNGVFAVTEKGARVVESSELPRLGEKILLATQSGPLLIRRGQIHPVFNPASQSRLLRNGVGVPSPDRALFVLSEDPVTFYQFALFFRDQLRCPDALFFDGTVSSLYSAELKRCDFRIDLGPMIGVVQPLPK